MLYLSMSFVRFWCSNQNIVKLNILINNLKASVGGLLAGCLEAIQHVNKSEDPGNQFKFIQLNRASAYARYLRVNPYIGGTDIFTYIFRIQL